MSLSSLSKAAEAAPENLHSEKFKNKQKAFDVVKWQCVSSKYSEKVQPQGCRLASFFNAFIRQDLYKISSSLARTHTALSGKKLLSSVWNFTLMF